jgi:hypothetical protein
MGKHQGVPKGTSIVDYREAQPDGIGSGYVNKILAGYIDLEETEWVPVIEAKGMTVIGYAEPAALDKVIAPPFDSSEIGNDGWDVFKERMRKEYPLLLVSESEDIFSAEAKDQ